ncbi:PREDICTED: general transcription factor II-I repeat domain-containing protein 2 isoform X1 [Nicrophorus vespilloides]|uniref:General transcription factor II-I repeat domain-containing protein 2 isoform X1 n=1 Tax=Nicrophorus vespilloides TaxID=110193 RepID=A0ABM1MUX2_NICVS|nr:PREDICTED: general transcription factor II-I repeat domain-containing protein 2 isoform X1 [Nicrophorus vespilloides]
MSTKKRRIEQENRRFKSEWTETYAFVENEEGLPMCLICHERLSNNKKSNIERHFLNKHNIFDKAYPVGDERKEAVEELQCKINIIKCLENKSKKASRDTTVASFVATQELVKRGKPFTDGEYLKDCFIKMSEYLFCDFENRSQIITKIKDMPLSAKVVRDRTIRMAEDITIQQVIDLNSAPLFSIACDQLCDVDDNAQIVLICRYITPQGPREELLDILPLTGQICGEYIESAIITCFESRGIDINKIISIVTDGSPNMKDTQTGFVSLFKRHIFHDVFSFHCIIHQEILCAQTFPMEITVVMDLVVEIVNKIMAKQLHHQQFSELLNEINCEYSDLLLHNRIRWIYSSAVLKQFATCLGEIKLFLSQKDPQYAQLEDTLWLQKFYFMVDMTSHLNTLNKKLQEKGNTVVLLLEEVISFDRKLYLFQTDLEKGKLLHFPMLKEYQQEQADNNSINLIFFKEIVVNMRSEFNGRFEEFRKNKLTISFLLRPLEINPDELFFSPFVGIDEAAFQLELEDLRYKDLWNSKFKYLIADLEELERQKSTLALQQNWSEIEELKTQDQIVFETWNCLPDTYIQLKSYAFGLLSIFGSTYYCEKFFSNMNCIKKELQ